MIAAVNIDGTADRTRKTAEGAWNRLILLANAQQTELETIIQRHVKTQNNENRSNAEENTPSETETETQIKIIENHREQKSQWVLTEKYSREHCKIVHNVQLNRYIELPTKLVVDQNRRLAENNYKTHLKALKIERKRWRSIWSPLSRNWRRQMMN